MIEFISPVPRGTIGKGDAFYFTVDDTYAALQVHVEIDDAMVLAYDATVGPTAGYQVDVDESGSRHVVKVSRDAGWLHSPTIIQVTEDEDTETHITVFSYDLPGVVKFPRLNNPKAVTFAKLRISEDGIEIADEVDHLDLVNANSSPDGLRGTTDLEEQAHIEAVATTTDPLAIHTNVAGEIETLTELAPPTSVRLDKLILEDSAAGFVKKFATVDAVVPVPTPSNLENDLGAKLLYAHSDATAADVWNSTADPSHANYDPLAAVSVGSSYRIFVQGVTGNQEGRMNILSNSNPEGGKMSTATGDAANLNDAGDITVQFYGTVQQGTGAHRGNGATLFGLHMDGQSYRGCPWWLGIKNNNNGPDSGSDYHYTPAFGYATADDSVMWYATDDNFVLAPFNRVHIAGVRFEQGNGLFTSQLWVNGVLINEQTDYPVPWRETRGTLRVTHNSPQGSVGLARLQWYGTKFSNQALTPDQINSEMKKALGYP